MFENYAGEPIIRSFPMITGFILDVMHLLDGGVLQDWLNLFLASLKKKDGKDPHDNAMVHTTERLRAIFTTEISLRAKFLNRFRMLEQSRPLRCQMYICIYIS